MQSIKAFTAPGNITVISSQMAFSRFWIQDVLRNLWTMLSDCPFHDLLDKRQVWTADRSS